MEREYLPEGSRIRTEKNSKFLSSREGLDAAAREGCILEAKVLSCDVDHNLLVRLNGDLMGIIPRRESAWGLEEGVIREIAVLSRVGKTVCFIPTEMVDSQGRLLLSRRQAQEQALQKLMSAAPGDILAARVTHLEPFGAFVDVGCGVVSFLSIEQISVSRIDHPSARFHVGQQIRVIVRGKDERQKRLLLSHRELLGTWRENAANFHPGETVTGFIRGVEPYGIFVELRPNLSGLAEKKEGFQNGQPVSVYIKSIVPETMKIKLLLIDTLGTLEPAPLQYYVEGNHLDSWSYQPEECTIKKLETIFA